MGDIGIPYKPLKEASEVFHIFHKSGRKVIAIRCEI